MSKVGLVVVAVVLGLAAGAAPAGAAYNPCPTQASFAWQRASVARAATVQVPGSAPITARVPALGFAMDLPCVQRPTEADPDLKKTGHALWKAAGQSTMTLVMRGFEHSSFTARGTEAQLHDVSHFLLAWLDRYLLNEWAATERLLADRVNGRRTRQLLSTAFRSAAFLPGRIDCEAYRVCLMARR